MTLVAAAVDCKKNKLMKRPPHIFKKISFYVIGVSLLMLFALLLEGLNIIHCFGSSATILTSIFSILIYVSIFFAIISSEKKENSNVEAIRNKVAARVFLAFAIILLCLKIISALFISQDMAGVLPASLITTGKAIVLFFVVYIIILNVALKRNNEN